MKKIFLSLAILTFVVTMIGTAWAESPPNRSRTIGKMTVTISGFNYANGVQTPLFHIHTGDISITRAVNREHGLTGEVYSPHPDSCWNLAASYMGDVMSRTILKADNLPYPMNLLSKKELGCVKVFTIYKDGNISIYLKPVKPSVVKHMIEKLGSLFNGVPN